MIGNKVKFNFKYAKEMLAHIISDFNSDIYGHPNVTADVFYDNYLYFIRPTYSLDPQLYEILLLYLISTYSKNVIVTDISEESVTIEFTDSKTGIISTHTMKHEPQQGLLILRTEKKELQNSFEVHEVKPVFIFWTN